MGTEAAFLVSLQHEYLTDAESRVAECLECTSGISPQNPEPLRSIWSAVHTLKGESGVVGFPHLLQFLSNVEDALTLMETQIASAGGTKALPMEACARLASLVREVFFAMEDYLRSLQRDYTDKQALFDLANETNERLKTWTPEGSHDWGMGDSVSEGDKASSSSSLESESLSPSGTVSTPVEAVPVQTTGNPAAAFAAELDTEVEELGALGDGYNFDVTVFRAFKKGESLPAPAASVDSNSMGSETVPVQAHAPSQTSSGAPSALQAQGPSFSSQGPKSSSEAPKTNALGSGKQSPKADPTQPQLYLMVNQDGGVFAIPLVNVVEIVQYRKWNALPVRRKKILGVLNLRGSVLPIFDLHEVLGATHLAQSSREERVERLKDAKCIVVVQVGIKSFGFVVETVSHVTEMRPDQLFSADRAGMGLEESLVAQMGLVDGKTVLFLDVKGLVA